jgi:Kef-type K+ transport system membrane component KefB
MAQRGAVRRHPATDRSRTSQPGEHRLSNGLCRKRYEREYRSTVIGALLVGKWIAAQIAGLAFHYSSAERLTVWSLTLPQVAATLAAALVAYDTFNSAGQRLVDGRLLNVVLVLMLTTANLGPVLTERFAPRMLPEKVPGNAA